MAGAGAEPAGPGGVAALPTFYEYVAPTAWTAVDFVSDLHLGPALPRTFDAFARYLGGTPADAVFILGDLFEGWIGDDARGLPYERRCVELLAEVSSRRTLAFMVGNRDFLLGAAMLRECGAMGLADPTLLSAWGRRVLLSHGDALCLEDTEYQAFRREVRSERWRRETLARPLAERAALALRMRARSDERRRFDGRSDADVDTAAAVAWLHAAGAAELVHGHTHRPGSNELAPGYRRHVLSDWDLDDGERPRAEVLRLTRGGFRRLPVR